VDLDVSERKIVGFLEPNGAGRTTALRMGTTLLEPAAGEAAAADPDALHSLDDVFCRSPAGPCAANQETRRREPP
jgi:ABC-type Na+ transport system ATPase subunit NatA